MKKVFSGLVLAGSLLLNAQEKQQSVSSKSPVTFGVKAGFNGSTLITGKADNADNNQKLKLGSHIGVFVNIPVAEKFSVQPELLLAKWAQKQKGNIPMDLPWAISL